jgi:hypothetical protein
VIAGCCAAIGTALPAAPRTSADYRIAAEVLPSLGGTARSADYALQAAGDLGGNESSADYALANGFFVPSSPELAVEVAGAPLANGAGRLDFGAVKLGGESDSRVVTLRNVGDDDLTLERFGAAGDQAADFLINATQTASVLAPGEATSFGITFKPAAKGSRSADVFVTSDDAFGTLFTSELAGEGVSGAFEDWQAEQFTAGEFADATISGPAADPDHDGVNNLLEYAFALDPMDASRAGLPAIGTARVDGADYLTISFTRRKTAGDLVYTIEASDDLAGWTTLTPAEQTVTDRGETETVVARDTVAVGSVPRRFLRVKVSQP